MKTYNDTFIEELVRRERPGGELIFKLGVIVLALILLTVALILVQPFFPFFFALICILVFFAFHYTVKEYEYSFINGDFDIDSIAGKRRRKRVLSTSCKDIKVFAPCSGGLPESGFSRVLDVAISKSKEGRWYFIVEAQDGGTTLVLMNPSVRLLDAFHLYLGKKMSGYTPTQTEPK